MCKRFLIVIFCLLGAYANVNSLTAADRPTFLDLDKNKIIETKIPTVEAAVATTSIMPATKKTAAPKIETGIITTNSITIAGRTITIADVNNTTVDSKNHVNKYKDKFLYGHNSSAVFGGLKTLQIGDTFSVNYNNSLTRYKIENIVTFEKNPETGILTLNGKGNYMYSVSKAKFGTNIYDLSLMTCTGTSYGNGDASHRLVIYAKRV